MRKSIRLCLTRDCAVAAIAEAETLDSGIDMFVLALCRTVRQIVLSTDAARVGIRHSSSIPVGCIGTGVRKEHTLIY